MKHRRDTCYYDGQCGLCQRTVRLLRRLDWLGRLTFVDMFSVPESTLPVRMEEALRGMPMETNRGIVLNGFPAIRRALVQTPLGFAPAALLYLPGVSWAGGRVYEQVAARRRRGFACARSDRADAA